MSEVVDRSIGVSPVWIFAADSVMFAGFSELNCFIYTDFSAEISNLLISKIY